MHIFEQFSCAQDSNRILKDAVFVKNLDIRKTIYTPKGVEEFVFKYSVHPKELDTELNLSTQGFESPKTMGLVTHSSSYMRMYFNERRLIDTDRKQVLKHLEEQRGCLEKEKLEILR